MSRFKKLFMCLGMLGFLVLQLTTAQAAMVATSEVLSQSERDQLVHMLEQEAVQQQLIDLGVDPASTLSRVNQLSDEELAQLRDHLKVLPAGAGITTVDLLIIIILVLLLA